MITLARAMERLPYIVKFLVAVGTAALTAAQTALPLSPAIHGWVVIALAVLGAAGVYLAPNKQEEPTNGAPNAPPQG